MALHGYLVNEIAEDFGDGLLTRREALRRLGLLGLGITGAAAVLAACGGDDDDDAATTTSAAGAATTTAAVGAPPGSAGAITAQAVKFAGPAGEIHGAFAAASSPKGAVLVIHENRGLTPHFFDVAGRLAGAGYQRARGRPGLPQGRHCGGRRGRRAGCARHHTRRGPHR